jgi:hypothetical protein
MYTFAQCAAGSDSELDSVTDWMERYTAKYVGKIITNFDEQRPNLADAPLSYQKLVTKTYDRQIINQFGGTVVAERIETLTYNSTVQYYGDVHMGHNISVGGNAIINIDAVLSNVSQTIGASAGLNPDQKTSLDTLVHKLQTELDPIKGSHPDESKEIVEALQKAVIAASKPTAERKKPFLDLSATGLLQTAQLVANVAPAVVIAAEKIATFIQGLV